MKIWSILGLFFLLSFSSCDRYLNQHIMLRTGKDYPYADFQDVLETEYRLAPNDLIAIRLFTNSGSGLLDLGSEISVGSGTDLLLKIEFDGFCKLPLFGRIYLEGLTVRQAEMLLEDKFSEFYNTPFVLLQVTNKQVVLLAGSSSSVVSLENDNTTLFEVIASAGGLPETAKAQRVKLIRGNLNNPEVFIVDLSTLEGMKAANLVMQANDIVYIETRRSAVAGIVRELAPYLALITSIVTTSIFVTRFTQ